MPQSRAMRRTPVTASASSHSGVSHDIGTRAGLPTIVTDCQPGRFPRQRPASEAAFAERGANPGTKSLLYRREGRASEGDRFSPRPATRLLGLQEYPALPILESDFEEVEEIQPEKISAERLGGKRDLHFTLSKCVMGEPHAVKSGDEGRSTRFSGLKPLFRTTHEFQTNGRTQVALEDRYICAGVQVRIDLHRKVRVHPIMDLDPENGLGSLAPFAPVHVGNLIRVRDLDHLELKGNSGGAFFQLLNKDNVGLGLASLASALHDIREVGSMLSDLIA